MNARAPSRDPLAAELVSARRYLLAGAAELPDARWREQPSDAYSPVGWHVGHAGATQARWLLPGDPIAERFGTLFDPFRTPKPTRAVQPDAAELRAWLDDILERVCEGLARGRLPSILGLPETFLVHHIAQHDWQHGEHVRVVAALCDGRLHRMVPGIRVRKAKRLELAGGPVRIGCDDASIAYDNERTPHDVTLAPFWLDPAPVTVREYATFVEAGGYDERSYWIEDGWAWRVARNVRAPIGFDEQPHDSPVTCLSWFEADAYARFRGARLPTEQELEAARVPPMGVWEWTASWFEPYPGFRPYPYEGYSKPWFGTHRVLRGASWATAPGLVRPSFRNWYEPGFREIPSGFRCAGRL